MRTIRSCFAAALLGVVIWVLPVHAMAQTVVLIDEPVDGTTLAAPATVQVVSEVLDVIDLKEAVLYHYGQVVDRWTGFGQRSYTASGLGVGDHQFVAKATRTSGTTYSSNTVTVHVGGTPPPPGQ